MSVAGLMLSEAPHPRFLEAESRLLENAKARKHRTYRQFALEEIILPNGPYEGRRLRPEMQPAAFVWFDELDKGIWHRHAYVGPVQSGKTLAALVVPLMHTLFERQETAILGAPKLEVCHDKWRSDFLPVIKRSQYADLLPTKGAGSRGGKPQTDVTFENGVTLKFMSGQGSDDNRSAFTSRFVFITEVDKMDEAGDTSRESDPVSQMEDRTMAYDRIGGGFVFLECTVSYESGRIWQEYVNGTQSQIFIPCPHCKAFVNPQREHFTGYEQAETIKQAGESGAFFCPACGEFWTEQERLAANMKGVLVHDGQEIESGQVVGEPKETDTFGFRMSAVNNALISDKKIASVEWQKSQQEEESRQAESLEKTATQKIFSVPYVPLSLDDMKLDWRTVRDLGDVFVRGVVPANTEHFTIGIDMGKRVAHWVATAWRDNLTGHVVDYGRFDIATDDLGLEPAMTLALRDFRDDVCAEGWPVEAGASLQPDSVWIDSKYEGDTIRKFCRESGAHFLPTIGRGTSQHRQGQYSKPSATGKVTRALGLEYHINWSIAAGVFEVVINSDFWKTYVHKRLLTPAGKPGSLSLFSNQGNKNLHTSFAKHMTAEHQVEEFVPGKGRIVRWEAHSRANHWFDAIYLASAAGHFCGFELEQSEPTDEQDQETTIQESTMTTPSGQPFFVTQR